MSYLYNKHPDCPDCKNNVYVRRHGKARSGIARYRCCNCLITFQTKYIYSAYLRKEAVIQA